MREGCKSCVDWAEKVSARRILLSLTLPLLTIISGFGTWFIGFFLNPSLVVSQFFVSSACALVFLICLCLWVRDVIIGAYHYFFYDKDDELHCHEEMPIFCFGHDGHLWSNAKYEPETGEPYPEKDAFRIPGMVLRVKLGGLFKRNLAIRQAPGSMLSDQQKSGWLITGRNREQITFRSELSFDSMTSTPPHALRFMNSLPADRTSCFLVSDAAKAFIRLDETNTQLKSLLGLRDWLGIGLYHFLHELRDTPAWSRSKVRNAALDRVEELLRPCREELRTYWNNGHPTPGGEVAYITLCLDSVVATGESDEKDPYISEGQQGPGTM